MPASVTMKIRIAPSTKTTKEEGRVYDVDENWNGPGGLDCAFEWLMPENVVVKPYLDYDENDVVDKTDAMVDERLQMCLKKLTAAFNVTTSQIAVAIGNKPNKISIHFTLQARVKRNELKQMLKDAGMFDKGGFDPSPYSTTTQKWRLPGYKKKPFEPWILKRQPPHKFMAHVVQAVDDNLPELKLLTPKPLNAILDAPSPSTPAKNTKHIQQKDPMCLPAVHTNEINNQEYDTRLHGDMRIPEMVPTKYWDDYDTWKDLLGIMHKTGYSLADAHKMSRRSSKYDSEAVDEKWASFDSNPLHSKSFGTLMYFAKEGDAKAYDEVIGVNQLVGKCMLKLPQSPQPQPQPQPQAEAPQPVGDAEGACGGPLPPSDSVDAHRVAADFNHLCGSDWRFHKEKRVMFNRRVWVQDTAKGNRFQIALKDKMMVTYASLAHDAALKAAQASGDAKKAAEHDVKMYSSLQNKITKMGFLQEVAGHFDAMVMANTDEDMEWDQNPDTFYFKNRVVDLKTGLAAQPDKSQHVTMTSGYDYVEPTQKQLEKVGDMLVKALPKELERKLYLLILASGLVGRRLDRFVVASGSGGNSKSVIHGMMKHVCGLYFHELNTATLCNTHRAEMCQDLANLNKKRMALASEPDEKSAFQIGMIKNVTGNDTINARAMYEKNTVVNVVATTVCECNKKPKLEGRMDDAIERRLLDIPFRSSFKSDPENHHGDYIFKKDMTVATAEFAQEHRCALFVYLLPYVQKLYDINFNLDAHIPESILARNREYMEDSDEFKAWLDEHYERVGDGDAFLLSKEMYHLYVETQHPKIPKKQQREQNYKWFSREIQSNMFVKTDYKERHQPTINGKQADYYRVLIGWRRRVGELCIDLSEE